MANYQINSQTGSYHYLVDTDKALRENTDDWVTWSAGPIGNSRFLHLSFVTRAASTTGEWLAHPTMLNIGADIVAEWCRRYNIPVEHIDPAGLRAGLRGICGHGDISAAWREVDHHDPGLNFPWGVFLDMVRERVYPPAPAPAPVALSSSVLPAPPPSLVQALTNINVLIGSLFKWGR